MIHGSASDGYSTESETYAKVRPSYHPDLVDRFVQRFGTGTVIELGAGTGIFTRQLVERGVIPVAVEPVDAMRATLQQHTPEVKAIAATAESTGLDDGCAETVVVAQAFHWFNHPLALAEIARLLRPGGHLVCLWNVRDESVPWVAAYTEIVDRHAGDTPRYRSMQWRTAIDSDPAFQFVEEYQVANPQPADPEAVCARALSTSFIAALDRTTQQDVLAEIRALTTPLGVNFDHPYRSELQAWQLHPGGSATSNS